MRAVFQQVGGHLVHTAAFGRGDPALLGISGSFGTWEVWQPPFEALSADHRTIAFDHFGTGQTRVPPEVVTFEHQIALVRALLDVFGVNRAVLAGDSSNTAVAIEVARRWPDRVSALVLVSGGIDYSPSEPVLQFAASLRRDFEATMDFFVPLCLPEDDKGHLRQWLRDIIGRTGGERAARLVESFYDVNVRDSLGEVRVPTLVLHGALDALPTSPVAAAEEMAERIPNARLLVLDDAGHVPTLSRPAEVAHAIAEFIGEAVS
jgi:pimeloyl-ACP methyl ester carboxylesterase